MPNVQSTDGEGGLLGLAISSSFASDHWLYIMHTSPTDNRIVRIKMENDRLTTASEQVLISGILRNKFHDGGRLRFGPDGKLYASTGDAQNGDYAQNRTALNGKILRLNPDGSVPVGQPVRQLRVELRPPQPAGPGVRLAGPAVGAGVRQLDHGRDQPDHPRRQLRLAGVRGHHRHVRHRRLHRAEVRTYPTADGSCSGIAIVRDALYVACAARRTDVPRGDQRQQADERADVLQRHLWPAAHGRAGSRTAACG